MKGYGVSVTGNVREINEDSYYLPRTNERFAAIADGMGGHQAGEVASALAIQYFSQTLRESGDNVSETTLKTAVEKANLEIFHQGSVQRDQHGMGTTLTGLWFGDEHVLLCHVGDSRAYLYRNRTLSQISIDHSLVNEMVRRREITKDQARVHPQRNYITRALGTDRTVEPDIFHIRRQKGDVWLLCTDGLSNYLQEYELSEIMGGQQTWAEKLNIMKDQALNRGGADNITAVILPNEEDPV